MRFLSVCSGIEAASVAWNAFGWEAFGFSEIEPFPCAVLAHHYPNVPNFGDMTKFKEWPNEPIDLLCGGTPCQSFSVAGLRKGLDDPRGNLMLTYLAIADKYRPKWLVWENVPGVLPSNGGRDFGAFLGGLAKLGYGFAYRVLDAEYFGLAQRRRRVFVVGCLGDWRLAAAVLFERHSLQGHIAPSREAGQGFTHDISPCLTSSGRGVERIGETRGQDPVVAVTCAAKGQFCAEVSPTVTSGPPFSRTGNERVESEALVCMAHGQGGAEIAIDRSPTLTCNSVIHGIQDPCVSDIAFAQGRNNGGENVLLKGLSVRRLTPVECERLQGFPDNYTNIPWRNKPEAPDGPRYKALGNSWAVPVARWIGQRIKSVELIPTNCE